MTTFHPPETETEARPGPTGVGLRVGINARQLTSPEIRGWSRYTINLLVELAALGVDLTLYSHRTPERVYLDRLPSAGWRLVVGEGLRMATWEHRWLPRRCRLDRVDLLHSPFNFSLPWSSPCPTVLTLHDAIERAYERPRAGRGGVPSPSTLRSRVDHWVARTRADRIITVSEHSRADLVRWLGVPDAKIRVVAEAADPSFARPVTPADLDRVRARYALPDRYVFNVGGWEPRKNVPFLVRGFAAADLAGVGLVLAGGTPGRRPALVDLAARLGVDDRLVPLDWVDEGDLPALYAGALGFVYPSAYEGFGLQLCEAMAVGCPTLAARATSLPEVLGAGGETFALDDPAELAGSLRRLATDPDHRAGLVRRARARSADFSWRKAAGETIAVYRSLVRA